MIDLFTLALTHGLMLLALWRLLWRDDLDVEGAPVRSRRKPWAKNTSASPDGDAP